MKYMITWSERSQGSPIEYENAQKRILEVFTQWKAPDNFKIEMFVIRVGILLDAACLCIRSAASGSCHGRRPGRA
jgi:hypothetical protein